MKKVIDRWRQLLAPLANSPLVRAASEMRAPLEALRYWLLPRREVTERLTPGDGRPIMVIPAFLCSDVQTWALRRFLRKLGYTTFAWKQGVNWGPQPGVRTRLLHRINQIKELYEEPVTLVGWSLGGYYAREVASVRPDLVREVITLGSPLHGKPTSTAVWRVFRWINQKYMPKLREDEFAFPRPVVPCLSIYTKADGIVPWEYCVPRRGHAGDCIEVQGTHIGLISNPMVMRLLAQHLGSPRTKDTSMLRHRRRQLRRAERARASLGPDGLVTRRLANALRETLSGFRSLRRSSRTAS